MVIPDDVAGYEISGIGLLKGSDNEGDAKAFLDRMLTPGPLAIYEQLKPVTTIPRSGGTEAERAAGMPADLSAVLAKMNVAAIAEQRDAILPAGTRSSASNPIPRAPPWARGTMRKAGRMLDIRSLFKNYGEFRVLSDISLRAESDEFVCLLGPSGCGKTTLLRIIAGLEEYQQGSITLAGRDQRQVNVRDRGFGIVFQSYSLFPNMTVAQNIGYGLKLRRVPKAQIAETVAALLHLLGFPDLAGRYPHQLSGGQQQRVAIGRAIAVEPSLLLDEPLSALDAKVRHEMRSEIRELQRRLRIPTIMVTHDQDEALSMADKIVCMNHGAVEQIGTPQELYFHPRTRFVADFIGTSNFFDPEEAGALFSRPPDAQGDRLFAIRPEELTLRPDPEGDAVIEDMTFLGKVSQARIRWRGRSLLGEVRAGAPLVRGQCVSIALLPDAGRWVSA